MTHSWQAHICFVGEEESGHEMKPFAGGSHSGIPFVLWWDLEFNEPRQWNRHQELRCFTEMLRMAPSDLIPFEQFGQGTSKTARTVFFINGHKRVLLRKTSKLLQMATSIRPMELLIIDGCDMAQMEFLLAFAKIADTYLASPRSIPVVGLPYANIFNILSKTHKHHTSAVARQLSKDICLFFESKVISSKYGIPVSISVIKSRNLHTFVEQVVFFYRRYLAAGGSWDSLFKRLRNEIGSHPDEPQQDTVDLEILLRTLAERLDEEGQSKVRQFILYIRQQVIVQSQNSPAGNSQSGISLNLGSLKSLII